MLLGANGAGKSTLLSLLSGVLDPQSGRVSFIRESGGPDGRPVSVPLRRAVAWMPQQILPIRGLRVTEQVQYAAWLSGVSTEGASELATEMLSKVRLDGQGGAATSELSGGQLRRLGLAQALARDYETLLLDEPTAGLDPAQAANFRALIRDLPPKSGIVVSTHQVAELDGEYDHVTLLDRGLILFDGDLEEFAEFGVGLGVMDGNVGEIFARVTQAGWL